MQVVSATGLSGEIATDAAVTLSEQVQVLSPPPAPPSADFLAGGSIPDIEWSSSAEDLERVKVRVH